MANTNNSEPSVKLRQTGAQYSIGIFAIVPPVLKLISSALPINQKKTAHTQ